MTDYQLSIMPYCLNPECSHPQNPNRSQSCRSCGGPLLLKDRYLSLKPIGKGGFGRTFLGVDRHFPNHPRCVIKQLYLQGATPEVQQKALSLFKQEALQLAELGNHPQIPTLKASFSDRGQFYLVQDWIDGKPLSPQQWQTLPNPESHLWQLLQQLLPVLQYIHQQNVIHRDIKPGNIMRRKADGQYILIDFGVARMLTQTALMGGATVIGTPGFMSPEQMRGKVLPASDLYSLGATCLNLLTAVNPDQMFDIINERWKWRNYLHPDLQISPQLSKILNLLVHPSLRKRAQSAEEVLREMGTFTLPQPPTPPPNITSQPTQVSHPSPQDDIFSQPTQVSNPSLPSNIPSQPTQTSPPPSQTPPTQPSPPQRQLKSRRRPPIMPRQATAAGEAEMEKLRQKMAEPGPQIQIDYTNLEQYLSRKRWQRVNWQKADDETWAILCELVGKPQGHYLFPSDLETLPCLDLQTIDRLWYQGSKGRFGFRVQNAIFRDVGSQYPVFCEVVGWEIQSSSHHPYLQFKAKAPLGHLPSRRWVGGVNIWKHAEVFAQRLEECGVCS
ncbi:serine/threonine-protein kinase [Spirulina sp. CS-785/01]|uniref:serine/threonine-protein kinase n=1 Tax=Spirulina sp. CS-785/01 TaxID=3021716 RepID=UPI00232B338C|nr:serine/threonine-protein kinase [Spirulina sp. CS-785/01]MDB9312633.1 serine/threonine-protein kinase [Spirulina sp. CS-785/01]